MSFGAAFVLPLVRWKIRLGNRPPQLKENAYEFVGIARSVKYAVDSYHSFSIFVEDGIRKTAYQSSTIVLMNDCMHLGRPTNRFETSIEAAEKLFS